MSDVDDVARRLGAELTERGLWGAAWEGRRVRLSSSEILPDLTDPATAGVLLDLLRSEASRAPSPRTYPSQTTGEHARRVGLHATSTVDVTLGVDACQVHTSWGSHGGATLGEAAARALLALWGRSAETW